MRSDDIVELLLLTESSLLSAVQQTAAYSNCMNISTPPPALSCELRYWPHGIIDHMAWFLSCSESVGADISYYVSTG